VTIGKPVGICLNGAAVQVVQVADIVIILTYADLEDPELDAHRTRWSTSTNKPSR